MVIVKQLGSVAKGMLYGVVGFAAVPFLVAKSFIEILGQTL
jgi:hypothetical protein